MDSTKYIGMDVHNEATTIAVISAAGKLVMESIVETKASTIVQLIEGLRGELYVTFEEGTWATWLYELLKPRVRKVVVCDPRKNALLKASNKSDRIDARKLAELLRGGFFVGGLSWRGRTPNVEGTGPQLPGDQQGYGAHHEPDQGTVPKLEHPLRWRLGLCAASSSGMVEQDHRTRRSSACRVVLSATGWIAEFAPGSTARSVSGEPPAWRDEPAARNPLYWPGSGRAADRVDANAASVSH